MKYIQLKLTLTYITDPTLVHSGSSNLGQRPYRWVSSLAQLGFVWLHYNACMNIFIQSHICSTACILVSSVTYKKSTTHDQWGQGVKQKHERTSLTSKRKHNCVTIPQAWWNGVSLPPCGERFIHL